MREVLQRYSYLTKLAAVYPEALQKGEDGIALCFEAGNIQADFGVDPELGMRFVFSVPVNRAALMSLHKKIFGAGDESPDAFIAIHFFAHEVVQHFIKDTCFEVFDANDFESGLVIVEVTARDEVSHREVERDVAWIIRRVVKSNE